MDYLLILVQSYEDWGIKSILIGAIIGLSGVVSYLYKSKERAVSVKDDRIMKVIEAHQKDLKESTNDYKLIVEKYHQFTQNLKDIVNARKI